MADTIKGTLTDCITNEEQEVTLEYEVIDNIFWLIGGPTGYESFDIKSKYTNLRGMIEYGWLACAGTPKVWDKLVISGPEIKKALKDYL